MLTCDECEYMGIIDKSKFCRWHNAYIGWHGCESGKRKPITNADHIRAMTDEELAEWIRDQIIDRNIGIPSETWLDWLRQEASDGKKDN